ncbi:MAG: RluA family pseudouridine synthase [Pseudomonadota bacterium]
MAKTETPTISDADAAFVRSLVIHEDASVVAFNKPTGLPVQTRGNRGRCLDTLLWAFARSNGKRPKLVHRLDAGTSGVIVAAKTKPAAADLSACFSSRRAKKTYLALAEGDLPDTNAGDIDQPLLSCKGQRGSPPMIPSDADGSVAARTHWRILSRAGRKALFELHPKTGRMHQLRAHLKHLGCPILGDPLYGTGKLSAPRLMLHAARLVLPLENREALCLEAPLPEDIASAILRLGLELPSSEA